MYLNFENGITYDFNCISDFNGLDISHLKFNY